MSALYQVANASTVAADAAAEMARFGMAPVNQRDLRTDGALCRFDAEGDGNGRKRNAWAVIFTDGVRPVVTFGHWARGIRETVVLGKPGPLSATERVRSDMAIDAARRERNRQIEGARKRAREEANHRWNSGKPASPDHPYLVAKRIGAGGLRTSGTWLLVPMRDVNGVLQNLQTIRVGGNKRFLKGGRMSGCYASIGLPGEHFLVCEGWATGQSLHKATGLPVAVAFAACNLGNVAKVLRGKYPSARITVCADNDAKPDRDNTGVNAAREAAALVGGYVAIPPIAGDWNDYINATADGSGTTTLREAIR
ncbi:MAG: toprim domain-containing protein [Rhodanobacter sp.]|nr:MAG: toprim domain-containing protein [Rhodanobacter sp.]